MLNSYREFFETPIGQLYAYRKRKRKTFRLWLKTELQTKTSANSNDSITFQKSLLEYLEKRKRRAFRSQVVMQLNFRASLPTPPAVHSLAKHYLDLLQKPLKGSGIGREHLLLKDDRQVALLICNYDLSHKLGLLPGIEPGLTIRILPLSDFAADLELFRRISNGDFREFGRFRNNSYESEDEDRRRDAFDAYHDHIASKQEFIAHYGEEVFENWRLMYQRDVQEHLLRNHEPRSDHLATLYFPILQNPKDASLKAIAEASSKMIRFLYEHAFVSVDFGAPAQQKGESKLFKQKVKNALESAVKNQPLMYPLLTTIGVSILYVPPLSGQPIDLDNLARRIIPFVHEVLKPPSTITHAFAAATPAVSRVDKFIGETLAMLKTAPKYHVTRYQVIQLPRTSEDSPEGNVRLIVHSGQPKRGPWDEIDKVLDKWADDISHA